MRISLKKLVNPYVIFAFSWALCLFLYSYRWSDMLPELDDDLVYFIIGFSVIFGLAGFVFNTVKFSTEIITPEKSNIRAFLIVDTIVWFLNFAFSGIPLLQGVRSEDFGIPTVIVLAVSLNSFTSVYCFYLYQISKKKKYILYVFYCMFLFLLAYSRGYVLMSMLTMFFVWIYLKNPKLTVLNLVFIIVAFLSVSFMFGVVGNIRTTASIVSVSEDSEPNDEYTNDNILLLGDATEEFVQNPVPSEFFWTYLYITSPIGNLQYNITRKTPDFIENAPLLIVNEVLFDSISNRINTMTASVRKKPELITPALTVCTTLVGPYLYAGWGGMIFMIFVLFMFPLIYTLIVIRNPLAIIGLSTLSMIYFFLIFDNMFTITAL
ncbi:oligosaccharide repeat unit polymerase, partial [bacterium]